MTQAGHDLLLSLLLCGLRQIAILVPRRHRASLGSLEAQVALAGCVLDSLGFGQRITVIPEDDPDLVEAALYDFDNRQPMPNQRFGLTGRKREIERLGFGRFTRCCAASPECDQFAPRRPLRARLAPP